MSEEARYVGKFVGLAAAVIILLTILFGGWYEIGPTERGVKTTLGHMDKTFLSPGIGVKWPFVTGIEKMNVQQQTEEITATCFSSDMQNINIKLKILFKVPETSVVSIIRDYNGELFPTLIAPRVQEATKEATATRSAADIVKGREVIKSAALAAARTKIGTILEIDDIVIEDIALSPELEQAITQKMVSQQDAEKAVYKKQQAQTDAETAVIAAQAQAQSIKIQGDALQNNPALVNLKLVEKWDGHAPQIVSGNGGPALLLPGLK